MREIISSMLSSLSRWPLLLGAAVCFGFAVYEEMVTDTTETALAVTGVVVGSVLLGGWLVSYVVAGEREHYRKHRPTWRDDPPEEG